MSAPNNNNNNKNNNNNQGRWPDPEGLSPEEAQRCLDDAMAEVMRFMTTEEGDSGHLPMLRGLTIRYQAIINQAPREQMDLDTRPSTHAALADRSREQPPPSPGTDQRAWPASRNGVPRCLNHPNTGYPVYHALSECRAAAPSVQPPRRRQQRPGNPDIANALAAGHSVTVLNFGPRSSRVHNGAIRKPGSKKGKPKRGGLANGGCKPKDLGSGKGGPPGGPPGGSGPGASETPAA